MKRLISSTAAFLVLSSAAFAQTSEAVATTAPADAVSPAEAAAPAAEAAPAAPAADPNVYQVLRTGDREMSCEQLSAEANGLNARLLADQRSASKKSERSRAGRAAGGAVAGGTMRAFGRFGINRMAGSLGPAGFLVAHAANDAVSQAAAESIANGGDNPDPAAITPEQQRMNHLLGLYKEKSC